MSYLVGVMCVMGANDGGGFVDDVVVVGVGIMCDGSGSVHRSSALVCFGGGVRLRWKTALLCVVKKSASLS